MANAPIQQIGIGNAYQIIGADRYPGPYEVTPAREVQTLETSGMVMDGNVTVGAIPENYGLIEWDGARLRIS